MINIVIAKKYKNLVDGDPLKIAAQTTLDQLKPGEEYEVTIAVEDDEHVRRLNQQFRQIDDTTDVLSFESNELNPENGLVSLGDIIISYPKALIQSNAAGHSILSELKLLIVHGTLHLLGYDHAEPQDKEKMWAVQGKVLDLLGLKIDHYPES